MKLRIVDGPRAGEALDIPRDAVVTIGRSHEATIRIDAPGLSRRHFELRWDGSTCLLRDLDSRNGVRVNGRLVTEAVLASGDRIEAANTCYAIEASPLRRRLVEADSPTMETAAVPAV